MIIQRYMDFSKFLSLIQTNSLYLAKMSLFHDALEGGLTFSDYFKTSNVPAHFDLGLNGFWPVANESYDERACRLAEMDSVHKGIVERQFSTPFGDYLCDEAEKLFPMCREWIYVSSWHLSDYECSAMWQIYNNDKNSLCVFSTEEKLRSSVVADASCDRLEVKKVEYISHRDDSFSENPLDPFVAKSKPYSFEKEVRLISWDSRLDLSCAPENNKSGLLLKMDLQTVIDKVVISPYADPWFKGAVIKFCSDAGLDIKIVDSSIRMGPITDLHQAMGYMECEDN